MLLLFPPHYFRPDNHKEAVVLMHAGQRKSWQLFGRCEFASFGLGIDMRRAVPFGAPFSRHCLPANNDGQAVGKGARGVEDWRLHPQGTRS